MSRLDTVESTSFPFRRSFLPWDERVKKAMDAGIIAVEDRRIRRLVWKHTQEPVGDVQIYPEDDVELLRRTRSEASQIDRMSPLFELHVRKAQRRVPMSMLAATSKAKMGTLRSQRRTNVLRIKAALNLIVCRGAYFGDPSTKNQAFTPSKTAFDQASPEAQPVIQFNDEDSGRQWCMQGLSVSSNPS